MDWDFLEQHFGIRFKNEDGSFRPINEWLKDVWVQCPSLFKEMMETIFTHGDELFYPNREE